MPRPAPRSVALEDDALFVLSSYFLGIEHPPGYPLFTLVGHLFTYLPFGSVAYRVHLASALFGALTRRRGVAVRAQPDRRGGCRRTSRPSASASRRCSGRSRSSPRSTPSIRSSFCPGLSRAAGLGPSAQAPEREAGGVLPWMALVFGLSLSNHWPLMLLVAPAFAVLLWPRRNELLRRLGCCPGWRSSAWLPYVLDGAPLAGWRCRSASTARSRRCPRSGSSSAAPATPASTTRRPRTGSTASSSSSFFGGAAARAVRGRSARCSRRPASRCSGASSARRVAAFLTVAFLMPLGRAAAAARLRLRRRAPSTSSTSIRCPPTRCSRSGWAWASPGWRSATRCGARHAAARRRGGARARSWRSARAPTCSTSHDWGARYAQAMLDDPAAERGGVRAGAKRTSGRWPTST